MKKIKIKNLKKGDILLDKDSVEVIVVDTRPFGDKENLVTVKGIADGITRIGSSPKNAIVRKIGKK